MIKFLSYIFPVFFLCLSYACTYTLVELISKWFEDLIEKMNGRGQ